MTRRRFRAFAIFVLSQPLFLGGCLHDVGFCVETPDTNTWKGIVLHSCAPNDAPQLNFSVDSLPMDCERPREGVMTLRRPDLDYDSLRAGQIHTDSIPLFSIDMGGSGPTWQFNRLEILETDGDSITASFRMICTAREGPADTTEGTARLKVCREFLPPLCG